MMYHHNPTGDARVSLVQGSLGLAAEGQAALMEELRAATRAVPIAKAELDRAVWAGLQAGVSKIAVGVAAGHTRQWAYRQEGRLAKDPPPLDTEDGGPPGQGTQEAVLDRIREAAAHLRNAEEALARAARAALASKNPRTEVANAAGYDRQWTYRIFPAAPFEGCGQRR